MNDPFLIAAQVFANPQSVGFAQPFLPEELGDGRRMVGGVSEYCNFWFASLQGRQQHLQGPAMEADNASVMPGLLEPGKGQCQRAYLRKKNQFLLRKSFQQ